MALTVFDHHLFELHPLEGLEIDHLGVVVTVFGEGARVEYYLYWGIPHLEVLLALVEDKV